MMVMTRRALSAMALFVACTGSQGQGQWAEPRGEVTFPDQTSVRVEIADTPATRQMGLMFRENLLPSEGMVFIFDEPGYFPFWMKNTLIPLDMLWLDAEGRVVSIAQSVPPCEADPCPSYPPDPGSTATYVVEVVAGFAKQHAVSRGDVLELKGIARPGTGR